jgi:hypothetical protein
MYQRNNELHKAVIEHRQARSTEVRRQQRQVMMVLAILVGAAAVSLTILIASGVLK